MPIKDQGPDLEDALQQLGAKRIEATLVASLALQGALGTREIVERTGLRQPEVSVGMQVLRSRHWVEGPPHHRPIQHGHGDRAALLPGSAVRAAPWPRGRVGLIDPPARRAQQARGLSPFCAARRA